MFRRLVPYKSFLISRRSHSFKNNGYVTEFPLSYPEFLHSPVENRRIPLYEKLVRADMLERRLNVDIPEFYVGSILAVTVSDPNMNNRQNRFLGICVRRHKVGLHHTFTLRNVVNGLGVEVMYDLYNPTIRKIETIKLERRLDDDLSYLIDALPEYSTFDFNLEPISHPVGKPVPVNPLKVKLRPPPWSQRWDMLPFEGLENAWEMATPRAKRKLLQKLVLTGRDGHLIEKAVFLLYYGYLLLQCLSGKFMGHKMMECVSNTMELIIKNRCQLTNIECVVPDDASVREFVSSVLGTGEKVALSVYVHQKICGLENDGFEIERWTFQRMLDGLERSHLDEYKAYFALIVARLALSPLDSFVGSKGFPAGYRMSFRLEEYREGSSKMPQGFIFPLFLESSQLLSITYEYVTSIPYPLNITNQPNQKTHDRVRRPFVRRSRRISHSGLLGNFEESALHGRLKPVASVDGFSLQVVGFNLQSTKYNVKTHFFDVSDDNSPSLYFGVVDLSTTRIRIKKKSRVQATLFNPHGRALKLFIVDLDLSDMPPHSNTFVRQRIFTTSDIKGAKPVLRYLINLRLASDAKGRIYMHSDIKLLFSNKEEVDLLDLTSNKEYCEVNTEMPENPKYSMNTDIDKCR
ncbi:unnamed protein product [Bursaphelenchus xylophilus]|uniref:Large ribosomal subunit protein bL19m n=1 Tax=Bursaphelenchus xylophilus TaxID=6326 RepID=A0A7I8XBI5_BURXY|nr:unnamed protein product [Bursaphelenchus xylophilus]CAG9083819.1 unnamed protein product [Bursaphelenchus xylophilus]